MAAKNLTQLTKKTEEKFRLYINVLGAYVLKIYLANRIKTAQKIE